MVRFLLVSALGLLPVSAFAQGLDREALEHFEEQIRPILVNRCYECHDASSGADAANLRLDYRGGWIDGGDSGPAVNIDQPNASLLLRAISYSDPDLQMPPRSKLPEREIQLLREWVASGAPGTEEAPSSEVSEEQFDVESRRLAHWAWQPVERPTPPENDRDDWCRDDVDRFVLDTLESAGLVPAAATNRETWLRRVTYDLTGLPPTVAQVEAFLADRSDRAFAKVVDRLLNSTAYGEHWAQHWLDLMRFAESKGHEQDFLIPHAWRYRDYVIQAMNSNVPHDQLLVEHIAGDLVTPPRIDPETRCNQSIQGTGWWHLGEATHSPVDIRGEEADRVDNQIDVFGKAFLGMTVACARCHDHKFDAISTSDYYALCGFIQSSSYQEANIADPALRAQLANQLTKHNVSFGRQLFGVYATVARDRLNKLRNVATPEQRARLVEGLTATAPLGRPTVPTVVRFDGQQLSPDDWITSGFAFGNQPVGVGTILLTNQEDASPLRIAEYDAASNEAASPKLTGMYRTRTFEVTGKRLWYRFRGKAEVFLDVDSHRTVSGPLHSVCEQAISSPGGWTWHAHSVEDYVGHRVHVEFKPTGNFALAQVCVSDSPPDEAPIADDDRFELSTSVASQDAFKRVIDTFYQAITAVEQDHATTSDARRVNWLLAHDEILPPADDQAKAELEEALEEHLTRRAALESRLPDPQYAMAMIDGSSENEFVHLRGSHKRLAPDPTPRRNLVALGEEFPIAHGSGRLELAHRIASGDNPLAARVAVNRIWAHLMGSGIVSTVDNLGVLGHPPTHPELLDYLASEFVASGWDTKQLIRRLVLSSTYRQASQPDRSLAAESIENADPANHLIHKARVRRIPAEAIRDALLVVADEVDATPFGPSVPVHITGFMRHNRSPEISGPMDGARRRSIYIQVRRNAFNHFLAGFDKPIPSTTVGLRNQSNSAAQPLMLLNDPLVHQLVGKWAANLTNQFDDDSSAIRHAYLGAYARLPDSDEMEQITSFLTDRLKGGQDPARLRQTAWFDVCLALVNSKEFVFLP